jgi:hypothetical protein
MNHLESGLAENDSRPRPPVFGRGRESFSGNDEPSGKRSSRKRLPTPSTRVSTLCKSCFPWRRRTMIRTIIYLRSAHFMLDRRRGFGTGHRPQLHRRRCCDSSGQRRGPHESPRGIGSQRRRPSGCAHQRQRLVRRRRHGHQPGGDRRRTRRQHGSHGRLRPRRLVARRQHRRIGPRGGDQPEQRAGTRPRRSHQPQHVDRQLWPSGLAFGRRRSRRPGRASMGGIRIAVRRPLGDGSQPQPGPGARRLRRPSRRTRRSDKPRLGPPRPRGRARGQQRTLPRPKPRQRLAPGLVNR